MYYRLMASFIKFVTQCKSTLSFALCLLTLLVVIGDEDFQSEPDDSVVVLSPNETRKCVNVTIIDDETVEEVEPFEVSITIPSGQPAIDTGEIVPSSMQIYGTVNIMDDDGMPVWHNIIQQY